MLEIHFLWKTNKMLNGKSPLVQRFEWMKNRKKKLFTLFENLCFVFILHKWIVCFFFFFRLYFLFYDETINTLFAQISLFCCKENLCVCVWVDISIGEFLSVNVFACKYILCSFQRRFYVCTKFFICIFRLIHSPCLVALVRSCSLQFNIHIFGNCMDGSMGPGDGWEREGYWMCKRTMKRKHRHEIMLKDTLQWWSV